MNPRAAGVMETSGSLHKFRALNYYTRTAELSLRDDSGVPIEHVYTYKI